MMEYAGIETCKETMDTAWGSTGGVGGATCENCEERPSMFIAKEPGTESRAGTSSGRRGKAVAIRVSATERLECALA